VCHHPLLHWALLAFVAALMDVRSLHTADDPIYPAMAGLCLLLSGWAYLLARAIKRRRGRAGVFAAGLGQRWSARGGDPVRQRG